MTAGQSSAAIRTRKAIPAGPVLGTKKPLDSRTLVIQRQVEAERVAKRRAPLVSTPPDRRARLMAILRADPGADGGTQADRMLLALRGGPITSHEARQHLDVIHPAGRVLALRGDGHEVMTRWVVQLSACGRPRSLRSSWNPVMPWDVPAILQSMSQYASSHPMMSVRSW